MTRPKLAWNVPAWSTGTFVSPLPKLRAAYGDAIAEHIETWAAAVRAELDAASSQDSKRTLGALAERAEKSTCRLVEDDQELRDMLDGLDTRSDSELLRSWSIFHDQGMPVAEELRQVAPAQLAVFARGALAQWRHGHGGRKSQDRMVEPMVMGLRSLAWSGRSHEEHLALVADALQACGLGYSRKSAEVWISKTGEHPRKGQPARKRCFSAKTRAV